MCAGDGAWYWRGRWGIVYNVAEEIILKVVIKKGRLYNFDEEIRMFENH